jgi:hypothetical protein
MSMRPARAASLILTLGALLGGCGGGEEADAGEADGAAAPVYTSEVRSVSRWVRPNDMGIDTTGLVAKKNPRGEGVVVYAPGKTDAAGEQAAWVVVDSKVVPLNEAARDATPELPAEGSEEETETLRRSGIDPAQRETEARTLVADTASAKPAPAPARPRAPRQEEAKTPEKAPADTPRLLGKPVRHPADTADTAPGRKQEAKPPRQPAPDTTRGGGTLPKPDTLPLAGTAPAPPDSLP